MKNEFPFLYEFAVQFMTGGNSRRLGPKRLRCLNFVFRNSPWITAETTPRDLGEDAERFWDLMDITKKEDLPEARSYVVDSIIYLYEHLQRKRKISPSFKEGRRSPFYIMASEPMKAHLRFCYNGREEIFVLRHGKMQSNSYLFILRYKNRFLLDNLIRVSIDWPRAWRKRNPCPLNVLKEAEEWFEGTTDNVTTWEQFDATMLDTARRHIVARHKGEWGHICMKFLFYFYYRLIIEHPEHDFFADSYFYSAEVVTDKRVPTHLAEGFELALYGQQAPFFQGKGALFIIHDAHMHSSSYRKTEIIRYDLSEITIPQYWNALANFLIKHERENVITARAFIKWLMKYKKERGEDPLFISPETMEDYRYYLSEHLTHGGSRNAYVRGVLFFVKWLQDTSFVNVYPGAIDEFNYFFIETRSVPSPLTKEEVKNLRRTLLRMGKQNPRFLLTEIAMRLLLMTDIRAGSLLTLQINDVIFDADGGCSMKILTKASNPDKQTFHFGKEQADAFKEAIRLTGDLRTRCPFCTIKEHIFIHEGVNTSSLPFAVMTLQRFTLDLKQAAEACGIKHFASGTLRDTYMSAVNLFMAENNIPDYKKPALTHHACKRSILNYAIFSIQDIFERSPQYTVGKIIENQ